MSSEPAQWFLLCLVLGLPSRLQRKPRTEWFTIDPTSLGFIFCSCLVVQFAENSNVRSHGSTRRRRELSSFENLACFPSNESVSSHCSLAAPRTRLVRVRRGETRLFVILANVTYCETCVVVDTVLFHLSVRRTANGV